MLNFSKFVQTGILKYHCSIGSCTYALFAKLAQATVARQLCIICVIFCSILFESTLSYSQTPSLINYQAVARHAGTGEEVAHQSVYIVCKIRSGAQGNIVYQEEHSNITTNQFGLFNLQIGGGEPLAGSFNNINWGNAGYWLELDMDAGSGLETIGSMQFVSVPYALHAETVGNADDADADPTNELIDEVTFNATNFTLTVQEAGIVHTADLSSLVYTGGNELVESLEFESETSTLTLMEGGNTFNVNLSSLIEDGDADDQNELINNLFFDPNNYTLTIEEAGYTHTANLSSLVNEGNNDNDPTNELIEIVNFNPATSELTIQDAGNTFLVDLSSLIDDADPDPTNELIEGVSFDSGTSELIIEDAGNTFVTDLSSLKDDDGDPTNELIESVSFDSGTSELTIEDAGNTFITDLSSLIDDADSDPTNELIESVSFDSGTSELTIEDAGSTFITDLSSLIDDADSDPTNELIESVSFDSGTSELTIEDAGNTFVTDLSSLKDEDGDPTNELIESVSFNSGSSELTIEDAGNTFITDLSSLIDDADSDPTNELIESVSFDSGTSELTIEDAGSTFITDLSSLIDDADSDPTNELIESISFNSGTSELTIEDAGNTFVTDLTSLIDDADADPTNELIQNFSFNVPSSVLTLTDAGATFNINLSALINDADSDPTNELQTLAQVMTYSGGLMGDAEGMRFVNLGNPVDDQDATTKFYVDRMPLVGDLTGSMESATVVALQGVDVSDETPSDGQVLVYNGSNSQWEPSSSAAAGIMGPQYYSVDPADFVGMRRNGNADKYGKVIFDQASEYVTIHKNNEGDKIIAPLHLPHNTKLSEIKIMFKKTSLLNNFGILLERKDLFTGSKTNIYAFSTILGLPGAEIQVDTEDLTSVGLAMRTIDNSQYSYRIIVDFDTDTNFNQPSDVRIMLYGVRLKYEY